MSFVVPTYRLEMEYESHGMTKVGKCVMEMTGLVDLETGKVIQQFDKPPDAFDFWDNPEDGAAWGDVGITP